jgi:hypothetical protein
MTIKQKIEDAIIDMSKKVERDSKHVYRNPETGEMYQGVSTVSSIVPKDWLSAWGAKETVKALGYSDYEKDTKLAEEMLEKIKKLSLVEYITLLKEVKGASSRKSKKALIDGTFGHQLIENIVRARIARNTIDIDYLDTALKRPIDQFLDWESKNIDYWIASESLVVNPKQRYAGQLDAIAMMKDGKLALIDFKFSSGISEDYILQCRGYQACFESYGIKFDTALIVRLPKTLEQDVWNEREFKYEKVPNNVEIYEVKTAYEFDRDIFYHCLFVKQWINFITNHMRNKK